MPEVLPKRRSLRSKRGRRLWWLWVVVALILLAPVAWIGIRGWIAKTELESAQVLLSDIKAKAVEFDTDGAAEKFDLLRSHTATAVDLTSDPVWRAGEFVPFIGKNLTAVREIAAATDGIITDIASPLLDVASTIDPASLAPKDGVIDLAPFEKAVPVVSSVNSALKEAITEVDGIDTEGTLDQIVNAKATVADMLEGVAPALDMADQVLPILPVALGSEGPRTYAVMFQNNAEPRALGGTALSFAVIFVDNGKIELQQTIPAGFENFPVFDPPLYAPGAAEQNIYPATVLGGFIANVTTRPNFIDAAEITQQTWLKTFGYEVDAIVSVDPVFLSYVLRATDPIALSTGDVVDSTTLVPLLLNQIYQRYNTGDNVADNMAQDVVYSETVGATFAALTGGALKFPELVGAIVQGWTEQRLLIWSAHDEEQAVLQTLGLPGQPPVSDKTTDRFAVYTQDYVGSKLGYYLSESVRVESAMCRSDDRATYRVTVEISNLVPAEEVNGLSNSITGQWEHFGVPKAWQRIIVMVYAPPGSVITKATIDGQGISGSGHFDGSNPVEYNIVTIAPGSGTSLVFEYTALEPGLRALEVASTPLVNPTSRSVGELDCATVEVP